MYTLCFYSKLVEYDIVVDGLLMNSYSIDVVVVMRCCCWWLKPWVIKIIELWCEFVWFLKVLQKWVKWWFVMEWCFDSSFIWIWVPFYVYKRLDKPWEQIWALRIQNWDFGVKMEFYLRANCLSSPWRANWWPWRVKKLSSSPWRVNWWPLQVVQYINLCFCRFKVLGADPSFLKCFFQHVWSLFLLFNLLEHLMFWDWLTSLKLRPQPEHRRDPKWISFSRL